MDSKLTLQKRESKLNNLVLYEDVDIKLLDLLINSNVLENKNDENYDEKIILKKYKNTYDNNTQKFKIIYNKSKNHNFGRVYAKNGISSVNLKKKIRHTLFNDKYIDIDIENCHFQILNQIMNKNKEYITLNDFCNNRDDFINLVEKKYNVDRDKAKNLFIRLLYHGSYKKWLKDNNFNENDIIDKIVSLNDEIKIIYNIVKLNNKDIEDELKLIKNNVSETSIMSYYLSEIENRILEEIFIYCCDNKYIINNDCCLCFDGIMISKDNLININKIIKELEDNIYDKLNINIKLVHKNMDNGYSYNELIEKSTFKNIIEINDDIKQLNNVNYNNDNLDNKRMRDIENNIKKRNLLIDKELEKINKNFEKEQMLYEDKNIIDDNEYNELKIKFEKRFFKLLNGIYYVDIDNMNYYDNKKLREYCRDTEFNVYYKNSFNKLIPFIDRWLDDKNKRTHKNIVFEPEYYNIPNNNNDFNLFNGFDYIETNEIIDDDFYFIKLLKHICNDEVDIYEYILSWIAHIIQKPHIKTKTSVVFYSNMKGVGKNAIIDCLTKLFNKYVGILYSIDDISKKFNSNLCNKLFIYGDEICAKASKLNDLLKNVITRSQCNLERKGIDALMVSDYSNYMFTTNNENAFKIEQNDRRMFMVRCSDDLLDNQFFTNYYNEINNKNIMNRLFNYFKQYKNDKWKIGVDRVPPTQYKKELEYESRPGYIQFIYKDISNISNRLWKSTDLFNASKEYCKKNYLSNNYTITEFGLNMNKLNLEKIRKRDCYYYVIHNERLFRKHLYELDKNYYKVINNIDINDELLFNYDDNNIDDIMISDINKF